MPDRLATWTRSPSRGGRFLASSAWTIHRATTWMMPTVIVAMGEKPKTRGLFHAPLTSDAIVVFEPADHVFRGQILRRANDAFDRAPLPLADKLNVTRTRNPGTNPRIVVETAGDSEKPSIGFVPTREI